MKVRIFLQCILLSFMGVVELPAVIWEYILSLHGPLDVAVYVRACRRRIAIARVSHAIQKCFVARSCLHDGDIVYVRTSRTHAWQLATIILSQTACRWNTKGRCRYYFLQHPSLKIRKGFL